MSSAPTGTLDDLSTSHSLFILPTRRDGLMASIRGRVIELEDPAETPFAPTPDELLILSIASDLAWSARRWLQGQGQESTLEVNAAWETANDPPRIVGVSVTLTVPKADETVSAQLLSVLEERAAARAFQSPPSVRLSET